MVVGEPLATALPHRQRPGFRSLLMALECGARRGPHLAIRSKASTCEEGLVPMKLAAP